MNSRAFWIAITAWSAKVLSSAILALAQTLRDFTEDRQRADAAAFPHQRRNDHRGAEVHRERGLHGRLCCAFGVPQIADLEQLSARDRLFGERARQRPRGNAARMRDSMAAASATPSLRRAASVTRNTGSATWPCSSRMPSANAWAGNSRSQHSTIFSNTGDASAIELTDDLQHVGGGRLLLQRLLGLVEQAHVLDRDHGLVGEGLQQRDLLVGEAPGLGAIHVDGADDALLAHHRHARRRCESRPCEPMRFMNGG